MGNDFPVGRIGFQLLRAIYAAMAIVLPVARFKICFHSFPDIADNAFAMFKHLLATEPHLQLIWLVNDLESSTNRLQNAGFLVSGQVRIIQRRSFRGLYHALTSQVYFHTHGFFSFGCLRRGQTVVNLWHGMPLKTIGAFAGQRDALLPKADYVIATSDFFADLMAEAFAMPRGRVWVTGQPRNDTLLHRNEEWPPNFPELASSPFVLWMPTYRVSSVGEIREDINDGTAPGIYEALREVDSLLQDSQAKLIVKLHPMDALNERDFSDFTSLRILSRAEATSIPVEFLLSHSTKLITDYSSVFIDYALLQRPIGFYIADMSSYRRGLIPEAAEQIGFPGTKLYTAKEIFDFVNATDSYPPNEEALNLMHTFKSGSSAARIVANLEVVSKLR